MTNSNPENKEAKWSKCCRCWPIPFMILGAVLIKGAVTFFLWNALVPELFHGPLLNYLQAVGLVVLAKVLFGGFHRCQGRFGPSWRRWEGLSPEERAKLKEEIRSRCE